MSTSPSQWQWKYTLAKLTVITNWALPSGPPRKRAAWGKQFIAVNEKRDAYAASPLGIEQLVSFDRMSVVLAEGDPGAGGVGLGLAKKDFKNVVTARRRKIWQE